MVVFIHFYVKESEVWTKGKARSWGEQCREVASHWKLFIYLLAFMTMMLFASHDAQDMYPVFGRRQWGTSALCGDQQSLLSPV